jgi:hypothetical protein
MKRHNCFNEYLCDLECIFQFNLTMQQMYILSAYFLQNRKCKHRDGRHVLNTFVTLPSLVPSVQSKQFVSLHRNQTWNEKECFSEIKVLVRKFT